MKRRILCLIFGGKSREYEVSLKSCACILKHIDRKIYDVYKIGITRDGGWYVYTGEESLIESGEWARSKDKHPVSLSVNTGELTYWDRKGEVRVRPYAVFPIIHGAYGEDGRLKAVFDIMNIKCAGCDTEAGAVTFNKYLTKLIAIENGVDVADFFLVNGRETLDSDTVYIKARKIGYPLFVKATCSGSSIGVYRVENEKSLIPCIKNALEISPSVLVERAINGTETEIAVLERNGEVILGKIGQIQHASDFYDYETKYSDSGVKLIIPAKIGEECENIIKKWAKDLFLATGCRGMCRLDFFVTSEGKVIFNEINTVPGFTSGSMYPLLMADSSRDIADIINIICL